MKGTKIHDAPVEVLVWRSYLLAVSEQHDFFGLAAGPPCCWFTSTLNALRTINHPKRTPRDTNLRQKAAAESSVTVSVMHAEGVIAVNCALPVQTGLQSIAAN